MNPESNSTTSIVDPAPLTPVVDGGPRKATAKDDPSRCQHRSENGTRCRTRGVPSQAGLCIRHFNLKVAAGLPLVPAPSDFEDLSADLLPGHAHFSSSEDLREFLSRLLIETTKGRVSPGRAAVLAYITNQLLHSHCVVQKVEKELDNQSQPILFDLPRPKRDWSEGSERAFYEPMSSQPAPNNGETPSGANTKESS